MKRHGNPITPVRRYGERWGFDDYFTTGKRIQVRRLAKKEAQREHTDLSVLIANGRKDLADINPVEFSEFRAWKASRNSNLIVSDCVKQLVDFKKAQRHVGIKWLLKLEQYLNVFSCDFGLRRIASIQAPEITQWLAGLPSSPRSRNNLRAVVVQLFRWAKDNRHLPDGVTEAERTERFKIRKSEVILTWTPEEMQQRLNVCPAYEIPPQTIGAFAGVRPEELRPQHQDKSPLAWEDFDWTEKIIHVRPETSKVNEARHVPISPQLEAWLQPFKNRAGPCCKQGRTANERAGPLLARLSGIPHKRNANRHSFISYWMAIHKDIGRCSEECGTSIYKIKTNYRRPANLSVANAFFNLYPRDDANIVDFETEKNKNHTGRSARGSQIRKSIPA